MSRLVAPVWLLAALAACGEPSDDTAVDGSSSGAPEDSTGAATDAPATSSTTADPTNDPTVDPATSSAGTTAGSSSGDTATSGDGTAGTTGGDGTTGGADLPAPELPTPTKTCPEIVDGTITIQPEGVDAPRDVQIWLDPEAAAQADGPVVFYWHGTGSNPQEAAAGLGELGIQEVIDAGGIVVAPTHDPMAGVFPWFLVLSETPDDMLIADEVLACAAEQFGVDARRIHSLGFSAGGLHTAQMSIRRSSYLASVVTYSGGLIFGSMPAFEDPDNNFAAMIFHGGAGDVVVVGFEQASKDYSAYLADNDDFSFLCDHGGGHSIPDAQESVMQFFSDHPYGTDPSPYAGGLPGDFPPYCALP